MKWRRYGVVLPERSVSVAARVCGPSESAPVAKSTCVPVIVGATVGLPSRVMPLGVTTSLASNAIELAAVTTDPSAGVDDVTFGALLSIRTFGRIDVPTLPSESTARARRS